MSAGFADILEQNMERGRGAHIDLAQGMDLVWKKGSTEQTAPVCRQLQLRGE